MMDAMVNIESFRMRFDSFLTGCDSIEEMGLWDREALGEMDVFYTSELASIVIRLIATDGKITGREVTYLNETFGFDLSLEQLQDIYSACEEELDRSFDEGFENGIQVMRKINEKLADAYKELLGLLCQIIIESDGIIAPAEVDEVRRLKALCQ